MAMRLGHLVAYVTVRFSGENSDPDRQSVAQLGLLAIIYLVVAGLGKITMIVERGQTAMLLPAISSGYVARSGKAQATFS